MTAPPVLQVREARKSLGERTVLRGVDLAVHRGEIVALLGPNGAGKTTLARAICGRLALDRGSVRVGGEDPRESTAARRQLGLVPQEIALYPDLTARENLEVLGRLAGVARRQLGGRVDAALTWIALEDRAAERVDRLSGGMKRRLNLAAGTLHQPDLLILDEPTVGVDPVARALIHDYLGHLRDRGLAILLTTHDLDQASELADRVAILSDGRKVAEGSLEELLAASFGGAHEVSVTLGAVPDAGARGLLTGAGLSAGSGSPTRWFGPLAGGMTSLAGLGSRLSGAGLEIVELRVREPGLRGVFFRLTGQELDG
jgi:ABC-2 type transport system ATP-binding protein